MSLANGGDNIVYGFTSGPSTAGVARRLAAARRGRGRNQGKPNVISGRELHEMHRKLEDEEREREEQRELIEATAIELGVPPMLARLSAEHGAPTTIMGDPSKRRFLSAASSIDRQRMRALSKPDPILAALVDPDNEHARQAVAAGTVHQRRRTGGPGSTSSAGGPGSGGVNEGRVARVMARARGDPEAAAARLRLMKRLEEERTFRAGLQPGDARAGGRKGITAADAQRNKMLAEEKRMMAEEENNPSLASARMAVAMQTDSVKGIRSRLEAARVSRVRRVQLHEKEIMREHEKERDAWYKETADGQMVLLAAQERRVAAAARTARLKDAEELRQQLRENAKERVMQMERRDQEGVALRHKMEAADAQEREIAAGKRREAERLQKEVKELNDALLSRKRQQAEQDAARDRELERYVMRKRLEEEEAARHAAAEKVEEDELKELAGRKAARATLGKEEEERSRLRRDWEAEEMRLRREARAAKERSKRQRVEQRQDLEEQLARKAARQEDLLAREQALQEQVRLEEDELNREDAMDAARQRVKKRLYARQVIREKEDREAAALQDDRRRRAQVKEEEERESMRRDLLERRAARELRRQLQKEGFSEGEIRGIGLGNDGEGIPSASVAGTRRGKKSVPTRGIEGVE